MYNSVLVFDIGKNITNCIYRLHPCRIDFKISQPNLEEFYRPSIRSHVEQRITYSIYRRGFRGGLAVKNPPAMQEMWVQSLGLEDPLEKETETQSSILAWKIPWTEEPGGLQSMGSQRVEYELVSKQQK